MNIRPCRSDVLRTVIRLTAHTPVVFTTGYTSREAHHLADRPNHFYMTGSMGMAGAIGMGIAASTDTPVVVVDGDGALLMNLSMLLLAQQYPTRGFVHLVLDNGTFDSTGGQPTASPGIDLVTLARATGYAQAAQLTTLAQLRDEVSAHLARPAGPYLAHIPIDPTTTPPGPRIAITPADNLRRLSAWISSQPTCTPH
ncbi:MAG TPA: thiamine pyrophosphate-dependent enzyme [Pseudonocardiaceae bacterium]|jgi:sulfopyruvate decarboxylase subunit beta|nr:thiamine pyrophosphate-dependent enzyme [Pseudonocardiaceae bacterium]